MSPGHPDARVVRDEEGDEPRKEGRGENARARMCHWIASSRGPSTGIGKKSLVPVLGKKIFCVF